MTQDPKRTGRTGIPGERFPLQGSIIVSIPWSAIAPHEAQATSNHGGQTLKRLAERCGLCIEEALSTMRDHGLFSPEWYALLRQPEDELVAELEALCEGFGEVEKLTGDALRRWRRERDKDDETKIRGVIGRLAMEPADDLGLSKTATALQKVGVRLAQPTNEAVTVRQGEGTFVALANGRTFRCWHDSERLHVTLEGTDA